MKEDNKAVIDKAELRRMSPAERRELASLLAELDDPALTGGRRRIDYVIDEPELRRLTADERRQLARTLAAIDRRHPLMDPQLRRRRWFGMMFMTACCVALACWIAILILTLPSRYTSSDWQAAWVGLDIAELAGFAATAWAAWHQRQGVIFCMISTGTLQVCDAWFDLALDYGSPDFTMSLVSALAVELPLAFLLFNSARRLVRVTIATMMQIGGDAGPVPPLWRIPLFADGLEECLPARFRAGAVQAQDVTAVGGPSSLGIRRSRGENRGHEPFHRVPAADVLDRLPDDREHQRRRGHRPGGLPPADPRAPRRRQHRLAQGLPGHRHHPAGHQPPAVRAGAAGVLRGRLAARTVPDGQRTRSRRARRAVRLAVHGLPRPAGEPDADRTRGVPAARGVRLRIPGDREHHRQVRAELPSDPRPGPAPCRGAKTPLPDLARAE